MNIENIKLDCPFCNAGKIEVLYIPESTKQVKSGEMSVPRKIKEKYEVQSDCSNCGKSAKEIQKAFNEGKEDPEKDKRILKRLKEQGFSGEITSKF